MRLAHGVTFSFGTHLWWTSGQQFGNLTHIPEFTLYMHAYDKNINKTRKEKSNEF